jgi:hypothetical protein
MKNIIAIILARAYPVQTKQLCKRDIKYNEIIKTGDS